MRCTARCDADARLKAATYTEKPTHASAIAARVGRVVNVSSTVGGGGGGGGGGAGGGAPPPSRPKSIDGAAARGRKVRSRGLSWAASVEKGGGLMPGAGISRAKQTLPAASTSLYDIPAGPFSPLTSHRHVRQQPFSPCEMRSGMKTKSGKTSRRPMYADTLPSPTKGS